MCESKSKSKVNFLKIIFYSMIRQTQTSIRNCWSLRCLICWHYLYYVIVCNILTRIVFIEQRKNLVIEHKFDINFI
jgi:hypothetical protein